MKLRGLGDVKFAHSASADHLNPRVRPSYVGQLPTISAEPPEYPGPRIPSVSQDISEIYQCPRQTQYPPQDMDNRAEPAPTLSISGISHQDQDAYTCVFSDMQTYIRELR